VIVSRGHTIEEINPIFILLQIWYYMGGREKGLGLGFIEMKRERESRGGRENGGGAIKTPLMALAMTMAITGPEKRGGDGEEESVVSGSEGVERARPGRRVRAGPARARAAAGGRGRLVGGARVSVRVGRGKVARWLGRRWAKFSWLRLGFPFFFYPYFSKI
jgi:hypothetical protein